MMEIASAGTMTQKQLRIAYPILGPLVGQGHRPVETAVTCGYRFVLDRRRTGGASDLGSLDTPVPDTDLKEFDKEVDLWKRTRKVRATSPL